jgi:L-threonylcarbamoyladenylate synthase
MSIIKIDNLNKITDISKINRIAEIISRGRIVILPTGTIYGLSCKYDHENAIKQIYKIKKRNKDLPFIIMISNPDDLKIFTRDINPATKIIIKKFWDTEKPGPLTLIFNKRENLKEFITGGKSTIALRVADCRFLRDLINICGPIISTSANISGTKKYPGKMEDIPARIKKQVALLVEYKFVLPGGESTIVNVTDDRPVLIREGRIKFHDIIETLKN